jgi:hypothetical protein
MAGPFAWHEQAKQTQAFWTSETPIGPARITRLTSPERYLAQVADYSSSCETREDAEVWIENTVLYVLQKEQHLLEVSEDTYAVGVW